MPAYMVRFYNTLCDGRGQPRNVCQRSIEIADADSAESAVARGKVLFAAAEGISDWQLHARFAEVECLPTGLLRTCGGAVS